MLKLIMLCNFCFMLFNLTGVSILRYIVHVPVESSRGPFI